MVRDLLSGPQLCPAAENPGEAIESSMPQFPPWETEIGASPFLALGFRVKHPPGDARRSCQEQLWGGGRMGCSRGVSVPRRRGAAGRRDGERCRIPFGVRLWSHTALAGAKTRRGVDISFLPPIPCPRLTPRGQIRRGAAIHLPPRLLAATCVGGGGDALGGRENRGCAFKQGAKHMSGPAFSCVSVC